VVDEVVDDWRGRVDGNRSIDRRVARGVPKIRGDRRWLSMALNELVDNAVKFSPNGSRVSVVAAPASCEGRPGIEMSVIDEGAGVDETMLTELFDPFAQGDASDTRRYGGLGLGLSLVRRVAEAHGGTVVAEPGPKKGAKFSIVLPV
jgi:signal transduction histidine kinase